jgi:hypothetical protein
MIQSWLHADFSPNMSVGEIVTAAHDLRKRLRVDVAMANRELQDLHEAIRRSEQTESANRLAPDAAAALDRARARCDVSLNMAKARGNADQFRSRVAYIGVLLATAMISHDKALQGPKKLCQAACRGAYASAEALETACSAALKSIRALEERGVESNSKEIQEIRESIQYAGKCRAEVVGGVGFWWRYRFSRST